MTLKKFIDMIGGMTDKNTTIEIRFGMNEYDGGTLNNIRCRLENKHYIEEYKDWKVSFFNIVDGTIMIQMHL